MNGYWRFLVRKQLVITVWCKNSMQMKFSPMTSVTCHHGEESKISTHFHCNKQVLGTHGTGNLEKTVFFPLIPINKWDKQTSKQVTPALSWTAWVREPAGHLFRKSLRTNTSEPTWRSGRAGIPGRGGSVGKSREARTSIILSGNKLCMCTCVYVPMLGTRVLQGVSLESV